MILEVDRECVRRPNPPLRRRGRHNYRPCDIQVASWRKVIFGSDRKRKMLYGRVVMVLLLSDILSTLEVVVEASDLWVRAVLSTLGVAVAASYLL